VNGLTTKHHYNLLIIIILACLAYLPGLSDFMVADDIPNIAANPAIQIKTFDSNSLLTAATANDSGPLKRPLASLSFGLNYYFSDKQITASDFKATNLAIHIFNGVLVYLIVFYLIKALNTSAKSSLSAKSLAVFIAAIWVLHPIQLTAVLYIVQRMASMSALFALAGLLVFIIGRIELFEQKPYAIAKMYIGIGLGTLLGALCKENALLLPYLALAIEITILSNLSATNQKQKKRLVVFYCLTAVLPAILALLYLSTKSGLIFNGYAIRNFTLSERLMTESRILILYITQLLYPALHKFTLYHDNIEISRNLLQPWTTLVACLSILASVIFSLRFRKKYPVLAFAILWFLTAHAMESSIFPLVLMYEHRNYLASFGVIFAAGYCIYIFINHLSNKPLITSGAPIVIILCLTALTHVRANIWSNPETLTHFDVKNHPSSALAHSSRAKHLLQSQGDILEIYEHLRASSKFDPSDATSLMTMQQLLAAIKSQITNGDWNEEITINHPQNYHDKPIVNSTYIEQLNKIINQETNTRLKTQKISASTTMALKASSECAVKVQASQCLAVIEEIQEWLDSALQNQSLPSNQRPIIYAAQAWINAYKGNTDRAFGSLDTAYQERPQEVYLLIEKLTLLITLHDWQNANSLIQIIETHPALAGHHKLALNKARKFYELEYNLNRKDNNDALNSNKSIDH